MEQTEGVDSVNNSPEYLAQLLKDKRQLQFVPNCFIHLERILDEEINRVRGTALHTATESMEPLLLPEPLGPVVSISEKLTVPVKDYPEFNFVGRLLGPRGMTVKHLEMETGCKILVRGKGSMRDKHKEEIMRGKAKWEHLNEDLHILITVEDSKNRASLKLKRAMEIVKKLLVPSPESEDELKKRQLLELALLNGTYRGGLHRIDDRNNNVIAAPNGNVGFLMMAAGPPFCAGGLMPSGMLSPTGGSPMMPFLMQSEHAGTPIFVTGPPPMFGPPTGPCHGTAMTPLPSPGVPPPPLVSPAMCKPPSQMGAQSPMTPSHGGLIFHHVDPSCLVPASSGQPQMFEFAMTSSAVNGYPACSGVH